MLENNRPLIRSITGATVGFAEKPLNPASAEPAQIRFSRRPSNYFLKESANPC
jgi:hypothetical protein